jgi:hypothetical protein
VSILVIYCSAYFHSLKNISVLSSMASGKHAPEGECYPYCKCTAPDLEVNVGMVCKYEVRQSFLQFHVYVVLLDQL